MPEPGSVTEADHNEQNTASEKVTDSCSFIGRDSALAEIIAFLKGTRAVTLVGAGGVGKSRLAGEVCAQAGLLLKVSVVFVQLALAKNRGDILDSLAFALKIERSGDRLTLEKIVDEVAGRAVLIVLDNCEHLIDVAVALMEALRLGTSKVRVLATSREVLRARGETLFRVQSLDVPVRCGPASQAPLASAVQLFLLRAKAAKTDFPSDQAVLALVGDICRRLDGIPLAIELAAERAANLGLEFVSQHLDERFRILTGGPRSALPRHQTLKASYDWSYLKLFTLERRLFRWLGVFVDGFSLDAACFGLEGHAALDEILEAFSGLVSKSLVFPDDGHTSRYRLHNSARAYALMQLAVENEDAQASITHARYYANLVVI